MKKTTSLFPLLILLCSCIPSDSAHSDENVAAGIERLKADVKYFSSDELKGREAGSEGITAAGEYIATRFRDLGIQTDSFDGTPFQKFGLPGAQSLGAPENNRLTFSGPDSPKELKLGEDFNSLSLGSSGAFSGELVFAGYGITAPNKDYDDYADIDVEGKVVIVVRKEPQQNDENSRFNGTRNTEFAYFTTKELNAAQHKAAAMILVNDRITAADEDLLMRVADAGAALTKAQVPTLFCKREVIDPILKAATGKTLTMLEAEIDESGKPQSQILEGIQAEGQTEFKQLPVRNVIGFLPGEGSLVDEFVVVGAHYDHVGMGGRGSLAPGTIAVHNGADDNASGTSTMLEVARRISLDNSENRRNVIFMAFTAEELGLLGSKHYVRNPRWPLEKTVAMVNMDMVGRLSDNRLTVYGLGTAKEFDALLERQNEASEFELDKREAGRGPSDHSSFYDAKIPVFHFFTGLHNDYHRPSDDFDKVNYEGMERIATIVTGTVLEIAKAEKPPTYLETNAYADVGRSGRPRPSPPRPTRAVLGVSLDLQPSPAPGVLIRTVADDGPAAGAGIQDGDLIIKLDGTEVERVRDLRKVLSGKKPGDEIEVTVKRDEKEITVKLELAEG